MVTDSKGDIKKLTILYIIVFGVVMFIYCSINMPGPIGEWDDYSLPVASILYEHNFSISDADVAYYKELFPNWAGYIDNYALSGYITRGGGELTWYFPIYSIVCIPFTIILKILNFPTVYAFPYTNLAFLLASVIILNKCLKSSDRIKSLMILLLTLNPIVFYISWTSAEVFIYSMLVVGLTFWYNQWYKRAAVLISVAGMLNPTIMSIGMIMIVEYFFVLFENKPKHECLIPYFRQNQLEVIKYGCCFIIGIIPMIYNYYNVGHINLTASLSNFTHGNESTIARFLSYIFDLNYGIFPFFTIILILSLVFLVDAIIKRNLRYIEWIGAFIINVMLYSIMIHINCGMSGISRYNSWGVLVLIFAVVLIGVEMLSDENNKKGSIGIIGAGIILTAITVFPYSPLCAINMPYTYFTPVATWTLDHFSPIYSPLKSTFNSRTVHVDGGYWYETPISYIANDGYIRKILASESDKEELLNEYISASGMNDNFVNQVNNLRGVGYISVSSKEKIVRVKSYDVGQELLFTKNISSGNTYIVRGMSNAEDWGTWTDGKETIFRLKTNSNNRVLHCEISANVYNNVQEVSIFVNGQSVYHNPDYFGDGIEFDFSNPGAGKVIEIIFKIPKACSPKEFGFADERVLGLGFTKLVITE